MMIDIDRERQKTVGDRERKRWNVNICGVEFPSRPPSLTYPPTLALLLLLLLPPSLELPLDWQRTQARVTATVPVSPVGAARTRRKLQAPKCCTCPRNPRVQTKKNRARAEKNIHKHTHTHKRKFYAKVTSPMSHQLACCHFEERLVRKACGHLTKRKTENRMPCKEDHLTFQEIKYSLFGGPLVPLLLQATHRTSMIR